MKPDGDAKQAFVTSAIMSDTATRTLLMGIFRDFDKFTVVTTAFMRSNLDKAKAAVPAASESNLAGMVARQHNGGSWQHPLAYLTQHDQHDYVKNFIGAPGYKNKVTVTHCDARKISDQAPLKRVHKAQALAVFK